MNSPSQAQTVPQAPPSLRQIFAQEQFSIAQTIRNLLLQGATSDQVTAWMQANASRIQTQNTRARQLSAYGDLQLIDTVDEITLPDGISQEMEDFLTAQATLHNCFAQIHNSLAIANGQSMSNRSVALLDQTETSQLEDQDGAALEEQSARVKVITEQLALQRLDVPEPLVVPDGVSAAVKTYLLARDQYGRDEIIVHNQNCGGSMDELNAAMETWREQNEARLEQVMALGRIAYSNN